MADTTERTPRRLLVLRSLALTIAMECAMAVGRFGLGLQATRDTASTIGVLTFGLRVHHGYLGLPVIAVAWFLRARRPDVAEWLLAIGIALVASDLVHHFLVLWPITGSPDFDLLY